MKGVALTIIAALAAAPVVAQTASAPSAPASTGLNDKMINNPLAAWNVYGPNQTSQVLDRDGPKGYPATRVTVSAKGANAWDAGSVMAIPKPIAAGDVIFIAVYLRAPDAKDGETVAMPFLGVTGSKPPYANVANDHAAITNQWAQYYAVGTAGQTFPAGGAQATVHLAGDKHVIDIGPIRVFDLGPGADTSRLPHNQ
jgi:hypothetical protein